MPRCDLCRRMRAAKEPAAEIQTGKVVANRAVMQTPELMRLRNPEMATTSNSHRRQHLCSLAKLALFGCWDKTVPHSGEESRLVRSEEHTSELQSPDHLV